jgi:hypothetical protein
VIEGLAIVGRIAVVRRFAVVEILYRNTDNFDRSQLFRFIIFMFRVALLREWFIDQHIYAGMCIDMVGRAFVLRHYPDLT